MQDAHSQWDNVVDWYDQNMGETGDQLNSSTIRPLILDMLGDPKRKVVLDVGCGSGYVAAELAASAKKVTGTDFSANFIALCREKYKSLSNLDFVEHDITSPLPFDDASFDSIICKMVLQYVPDIRPFSAEAMRLLKDKGELIVIVDHPFRAAYFNAQSEDGPGSDLFSSQPQTKTGLWGKTELTWYARTISEYIKNFTNPGLRLADMQEPVARVNVDNPLPFSVLALKFIK